MLICQECGKTNLEKVYGKKLGKRLCQKCYNYEKNHPVNPLPEKGEIKYDNEGRLICHICGRAFKKLSSHAINGHGITAYEYKKMFGLNNNAGLLIETTKEQLRRHIKNNYDLVVEQNLIEKGTNTRFEDGGEGRTRDKIRLQCMNVLINNTIKKNSEDINMQEEMA